MPPSAPPPTPFSPWEHAWTEALYGAAGFYRRPEGPAGHFRTACHAAPRAVAAVVLRLAAERGCTDVIDVGAGRGELAAALCTTPHTTGLPVRAHALDVVPRPSGLPPEVGWTRVEQGAGGLGAALRHALTACAGPVLVTAFELLDVVPCPVVEIDDDDVPRLVEVQVSGRERLAGPPGTRDDAWLRTWWPLDGAQAGARAEVGHPRDDAWSALVSAVAAHAGGGALLAVDYAHTRASRPFEGSLSGFRAGREVPPRPDGGTDVTAHVAMDAVAAAGEAAGATTVTLLEQADAVRCWWPSAPAGEPPAELLDRGSLGGFSWLVQAVAPR